MVSDLKYAVHRPKLILSYGFYAAIVVYQIVSSKLKIDGLKSKGSGFSEVDGFAAKLFGASFFFLT